MIESLFKTIIEARKALGTGAPADKAMAGIIDDGFALLPHQTATRRRYSLFSDCQRVRLCEGSKHRRFPGPHRYGESWGVTGGHRPESGR